MEWCLLLLILKVPSNSDMLNTCASGILMCFAGSGAIPSTHGDIKSSLILSISLSITSAGVTIECPNLSSSVIELCFWYR